MSYNGSGSFVRLFSWVTDRINSVKILAERMDAEFDGIATGLSNAITKDGQTTTTTRIPFASGISVADGTVSLPAVLFTADPDTGIYRNGTNNIGIAANAAKVVDISTVGVGVTGTLSSSGNFAVNTTAFTVAASTGNTVAAGTLTAGNTTTGTLSATTGTFSSTLSAAGNFSVATTAMTVAAATGNTTIGGTLRLLFYGAGTLQTDGSGNVTASSDVTMKNVSGGFTRGMDDLRGLYPKVWRWKAETGLNTTDDNVGFIAQDVIERIPEAVGVGSDGKLTLSDRALLAAVVNALNELDERVEFLEGVP